MPEGFDPEVVDLEEHLNVSFDMNTLGELASYIGYYPFVREWEKGTLMAHKKSRVKTFGTA